MNNGTWQLRHSAPAGLPLPTYQNIGCYSTEECLEIYIYELRDYGWEEYLSGTYSTTLKHKDFPNIIMKLYNENQYLDLKEAFPFRTVNEIDVYSDILRDCRVPMVLGTHDFGFLMTVIDGVSILDLPDGYLEVHAERLIDEYMEFCKEMLCHGWFPHDLNSTNVILRKDEKLGFIDFNRFMKREDCQSGLGSIGRTEEEYLLNIAQGVFRQRSS